MSPPNDGAGSLLALEARDGHVLVKVRASPGASRDAITGVHGDALKVAVTAAPERGKANAAVARLLAKALGLPKSAVSVHSGETSRDKQLRIEHGDADEVRRRLDHILGRAP